MRAMLFIKNPIHRNDEWEKTADVGRIHGLGAILNRHVLIIN